ncbi:MAG: glutamine synthetase, partial [Firmicutes bacterium]|nr:glutamine synthetase [Bacillota bacterium]
DDATSVDYDRYYWGKIDSLRNELGRDKIESDCLLTQIVKSLAAKDYSRASDLQIDMQRKVEELRWLYIKYKKNLF